MKGQSSFDYNGLTSPFSPFSMRMGYESYPALQHSLKDWGFATSFLGEQSTFAISSLTVAKKFDDNSLSIRYSPGFEKEFTFVREQNIISNDSSSVSLETKLSYKELFSVGYSYSITEKLSAGISIRYFAQKFNEDLVGVVFSDTLYLVRSSEESKVNFWNTNLSLHYQLFNNLNFTFSTSNLYLLKDGVNSDYEIRSPKSAFAIIDYSPFKSSNIVSSVESNGSYFIGVSSSLKFLGGNVGFNLSYFNRHENEIGINGIIPALHFQTDAWGVSVSMVKYLSRQSATESYSEFVSQGFSSIVNNKYSRDKYSVSLYASLNTKSEKKAKFLSVEYLQNIFPTLTENYLDKPFASVRVVNNSNKTINVKPGSKIDGINDEIIFSPFVLAAPYDTVVVDFYTVINESYSKTKAELSFVNLFLTTDNDSYDDVIQKPILINGINSWNGNVSDLRYFLNKDYDYSLSMAKKILSEHKSVFDSLASPLETFIKMKILYNEVFTKMLYVSDPNSSSDRVQFPSETISLKGGDCDDFAVCYSSLLESIGIQTAFVDYRNSNGIRHVNLLVNTTLAPENAQLITQNDQNYYLRKNGMGQEEIWIPIETTELKGFNEAWNAGVELFRSEAVNNLGLVKNKVQIIDVY